MYRNREDLTALIKMLSKGEKRYFVDTYRSDKQTQAQPLFLQLYDVIEKDKSELPKIFKQSSPQVLTTTKRRLYHNIMKSLRSLHDNASIDITIQNQLSEIEILYRGGLPHQGMFLLNKTYALARTHEKFGLVLQILEWEKRLNIVLDEPSRPTAEIVAEEKTVLKMYAQVMDLESIYSKAKELKKAYGFVKGESKEKMLEKETIKAPAMPTLKACLSEKAVYYYNFIHALYYWMTFNHSKAYAYSKELLASKVKVVLPADYIDGIFEHITSSVCVANFKDALAGIALGISYVEEQKLDQSHAFMLRMFAYECTYRLIVYNYTGERSRLEETIAKSESKLRAYESLLPFEMKQVISGNLMNAYMGIGEMDKADEVWERLFNRHSQTVRRDIYTDLHLFRMFSLLHTKSYDLIPVAAATALRYFRKYDDAEIVFEVEMPIAQLLQKERNYQQPGQLIAITDKLKNIISSSINNLKLATRFQEHYSRYEIWCDAIIHDEPYYKAAQRWHRALQETMRTASKKQSRHHS